MSAKYGLETIGRSDERVEELRVVRVDMPEVPVLVTARFDGPLAPSELYFALAGLQDAAPMDVRRMVGQLVERVGGEIDVETYLDFMEGMSEDSGGF